MLKVIVFDMAMEKGVIARGTTDGKLVDKYYLRVNGELYHSACIIQDTSEAQCALELAVKTNKAAKDAATMTSMLAIRFVTQHYGVKPS